MTNSSSSRRRTVALCLVLALSMIGATAVAFFCPGCGCGLPCREREYQLVW